MRSEHSGFTLLEMIAGMAIITIGLTAAIPPYLRNMRQGEVDRYTQQLEAGLFGLRAKLGQQKTSCALNFDQNGLSNFVAPADLVEMPDDLIEMPKNLVNSFRTLNILNPVLVCEFFQRIKQLMTTLANQ